MLPDKLKNKLILRERENALRQLGAPNHLIDFSSNDYLGFSNNKIIFKTTSVILKRHNLEVNGATGSRLLSGNHSIYTETETIIAKFHNNQEALILNSGYDANIGFFSSVPQRGDVIIYDELCHASIRDGIKMSHAKGFKFKHNNLQDLELRLRQAQSLKLSHSETTENQIALTPDQTQTKTSSHPEPVEGQMSNQIVYVVTESIFSMDGDQPDLKALAQLCKTHNAHLIVDEAHAVGVFGKKGEGLIQALGIEKEVFARIITFGKALGCHGAAILGSSDLKRYLVNFARSFIYTTGLPPHAVATIQAAYKQLLINDRSRLDLKSNIAILRSNIVANSLDSHFILSNSAIHCCVIPGNSKVKKVSEAIKSNGFEVKPILSPTVAKGEERLRICIHSYNTKDQIDALVATIATFVK